MSVPGRAAISILTAIYGLLVVVANARNDVITSEFTREWVLFGSRTDFPGGFGRNVFAGTIALGILVLVLAAVTWATAGHSVGRWLAAGAATFAFVIVAAYRDDGSVLGAKPSAAAVILAVAFYLGASAWVSSAVGARSGSE